MQRFYFISGREPNSAIATAAFLLLEAAFIENNGRKGYIGNEEAA